jgi:hypothetical protein
MCICFARLFIANGEIFTLHWFRWLMTPGFVSEQTQTELGRLGRDIRVKSQNVQQFTIIGYVEYLCKLMTGPGHKLGQKTQRYRYTEPVNSTEGRRNSSGDIGKQC